MNADREARGSGSALAVEHVSYSYGDRPALVDVTFQVAPASFTVLLGLNGAGKSTLFALLTRLYSAQAGRIRVFGHDIANEPGAALNALGVVFQTRALDVDISVRQNLVYHGALHGIARRSAGRAAERVLSRVALADRLDDRVADLSGGQMRRVEIARALLHEPRLLLLDEPTVGLDVRARADILSHVRGLASEGVGVLWATHLIDEVDDFDDLVVLHQGRVLTIGSARRVVADAGSPDVRAAFSKLVGDGDAATTDAIR